MIRLVSSIIALGFVVSFGACEQHSVAALPPHYKHKMHHGPADPSHPVTTEEAGLKEAKDPNRKHEEKAIPANPEAKPGENPVKKH